MVNHLTCHLNLVAPINHMVHRLYCLHPLAAVMEDLQVHQVLGQVDGLVSHR